MTLESINVLHMVCKDTLFSAAVFMTGDKTRHVWDAYLRYWVYSYVGYSKEINADRGPQFNSDEWRHLLQSAGIARRDSGVESHNSLGADEKYHDFLRLLFRKARCEHPALPKEDCLSVAVHAINNTAGPGGLVAMLLVFGIVPRLLLGFSDLPLQRSRMEAMHKARREIAKAVATARLRTALHRNVPAAADRDILIGTQVLCYKEGGKEWEGPYTVVAGDGKQLWLKIKGELKLISVDKLRTYAPPLPDATPTSTPEAETPEATEPAAPSPNVRRSARLAAREDSTLDPSSLQPWIHSASAADTPFEQAITGEAFLSKVYDVYTPCERVRKAM